MKIGSGRADYYRNAGGLFVAGLLGIALPGASCGGDYLAPDRKSPSGAPADPVESVVIELNTELAELQAVFHFQDTMESPTGGKMDFPAGFFDGFADQGLKSFIGVDGILTTSPIMGFPLFLTDNTRAMFGGFPSVTVQVQGDSMVFTADSQGSPIPPGAYVMSFFPGVFNLNSGTYDLPMEVNWPQNRSVTFNKLLLVNAAVVPHFGVGTAGGIDIGSIFVVNNPGSEPVDVGFSFRKQDGSPFGIVVGGAGSSQAQLLVPPLESAFLEVNAALEGMVEAGWALLQGDGPFRASVLFANRDDGKVGMFRRAAGISASRLSTQHGLAAIKTLEGVNTAVAIANPTAGDASITLRLTGEDVLETQIALESGEQVARFTDDFFEIAEEEFFRTLFIFSDTDLAVMSLLTFEGEQIASLPSGTF